MKNTDWKAARAFVLEKYPNAVCFKYKKGNLFSIFSDRDMIKAERLSKSPFEGRTATNKQMAWIEAKEKLEKINKLQTELPSVKYKKTI